MRDKIIEQVVNKIKRRSDVGYKKYGVTLYDDDQPLDAWLTHLQEELMDAVNYLEKAKMSLREEIEECYIKDINVVDPEAVSAHPEPDFGDMWTTNRT
jgi:nucleoid-associated protein YejK